MARGQRTKAGHIIQMIWHSANPNLFNPNGKRVVAHNAEDYDFIDGVEFDKLGRKGAKALIANVPLEEMWTGKISGPLHYNLMDDQIFPFWIAKGVETPIVVGGVNCIDTEYVRPQLDRADREFFSIEEGKAGGGASLGCYGMFTSFKWTSKRGNKGKSRMEFGFATQAAVRRQSLTGGTAQNHKFRVSANNVAGPVGLSIVVPGVAQAKTVSLAIGDTVQQMVDKFTAQGLTATVAGTINAGAGERHTVSGTGPLSVYGIEVFSKSIASLQDAIRAIDAAHQSATIAVGSTINQAVGPQSVISGGTVIFSNVGGNGGTPASAFDGNRATYWNIAPGAYPQWIGYDRGAGNAVVAKSYQVVGYEDNNPNNPASWTFEGSNDNATWAVLDTKAAQPVSASNLAAPAIQIANSTAYRYYRLNVSAASGGSGAAVGELKILDGTNTPASANLTVNYDVAAGNIADLVFVGAGYAGQSIQPGAAGGNVEVEVTGPGNVLLTVTKASGDANYAIANTQYGSSGSILQAMKADDPIMPGHLFLYSSDTPVGLDDEANIVGQIGEWEIDDPKICMPVSHHIRINDPERPNLPATYNAHAEEESQEDGIKLNITMDADEDGAVIATMQSLLRASGSRLVSLPRYWRIAAIHPGSPQRVWIDFYGSIGASAPVKWGGSVEQYTFVYDLLENKSAPWNFKAKTRRLA